MSYANGGAIASAEEIAEIHAIETAADAKLKWLADACDDKAERLLAEAARNLGGEIVGAALPENVRGLLELANRIASFVPLLPDVEIPVWTRQLAKITTAIARALGI